TSAFSKSALVTSARRKLPLRLAPLRIASRSESNSRTARDRFAFSKLRKRSIHDDAPDALALMHQVEAFVDVRKRHGVRDQRVDLDLAVHVPVDDLWYVGTPPRAAKRGALPDPPRDQLERTRRDFRAGGRNADNDRLAPTPMAGLECLTH